MKFRYRILCTCLLMVTAASCASALAAEGREMQLIRLFSDSGQSIPRAGEPYRIMLDGRFSEYGVTDQTGAVSTSHRQRRTHQEFLAEIFAFGTFSFVVDNDDQVTVQKIADWSLDAWRKRCDQESGDCNGRGFYWIRLLGLDVSFEDEPYVLTMDGETLTGSVAEDGYLFVPQDDPPAVSRKMVLHLCSGLAIELVAGVSEISSYAKPVDAGDATILPAMSCEESKLSKYGRDNPGLNGGVPYVLSEWSKGLSPTGLAEQVAAKQQSDLDLYHQLAVSNSDPLAWLGVLPPYWSEGEYQARLLAVLERIRADLIAASDMDVSAFQCRSPGQIGPIPSIDAVDKYLDSLPDGIYDQRILADLYSAAAKGNWLAVVQVYMLESQRFHGDGDYLARYRLLQLIEWLQAKKIGALYREYGAALAASGISNGLGGSKVSLVDVYAALRGSYPAQYEVGEELADSDDVQLSAVGKRMMDCALSALPSYRRQLERD